jgi:hypothetical protein
MAMDGLCILSFASKGDSFRINESSNSRCCIYGELLVGRVSALYTTLVVLRKVNQRSYLGFC